MSVRLRPLIALAAIATVAVLAAAGPAAATSPPGTTSDPTVAAAGWLAQQFVGTQHRASPTGDHFEGSFPGTGGKTTYYFDGGTTADAVFALAAAKAGTAKIDAAMTYFRAHVAEYTSVNDTSGAPGPSDGQVAKTALAAIVAGVDPRSFSGFDLLQTLKDDECTGPSGSTTDFSVPTCPAAGAARNIFSSVSESLAILVQARVGGAFTPSPAAVGYFLSLQCPNGGFTGLTSACTKNADASVDETAYASMALAALGGHAGALAAANSWLVSQRNSGGYWVAQNGPDVDTTGLAAAALDAAGVDTSTSHDWLVTQQVTDGPTVGTGATRGALKYQGAFDASSSIKATADGLLGLAAHSSLATLTAKGGSASVPVLALEPAAARTASVHQGDPQTVSASGFSAGETVTGVLHSAPVAIGSAKASRTGTVTLRFTVPARLAPGSHTVVLTGVTSGLSTTSASFTVTAAPVTPTATPTPTPSTPASPGTQDGAAGPSNCDAAALACTGRDGQQTRAEVGIGLGLLVAGAGAVYAGRRRRA